MNNSFVKKPTQTPQPLRVYYSIPYDQKEFWGAEYLDFNGKIETSKAIDCIRDYTEKNTLRGDQEFRLDDTLKKILNTDREYMLYTEIPNYLKYLEGRIQKKAGLPGATHKWCPAKRTYRHTFGSQYHEGNTWHGPVFAADCIDCGFTTRDTM